MTCPLSVATFDEKKRLLDYPTEPLTGNRLDLRFKLPTRATSIMAVIAGDRTKSLVLKLFDMNGLVMNRELKFAGFH